MITFVVVPFLNRVLTANAVIGNEFHLGQVSLISLIEKITFHFKVFFLHILYQPTRLLLPQQMSANKLILQSKSEDGKVPFLIIKSSTSGDLKHFKR